jgi:hypothetical protein
VFGLLILSIMTNLCYVLGVPLALFRLDILVAALVSLRCCLRWAAASRRLREARLSAWVLRLAAVVLAAVLCAEIWGEAKLADDRTMARADMSRRGLLSRRTINMPGWTPPVRTMRL